MSLVHAHNWWLYANCFGADLDTFFPENGRVPKVAKRICEACDPDVKAFCLTDAIENDDHGLRGGLTEKERAKLIGKDDAA